MDGIDVSASMKGGHTAPRNGLLLADQGGSKSRLNEGGAYRPPKQCEFAETIATSFRLNEGGAYRPPKPSHNPSRAHLASASMKGGHTAPRNKALDKQERELHNGLNEGGAYRPPETLKQCYLYCQQAHASMKGGHTAPRNPPSR